MGETTFSKMKTTNFFFQGIFFCVSVKGTESRVKTAASVLTALLGYEIATIKKNFPNSKNGSLGGHFKGKVRCERKDGVVEANIDTA